MMPGNTGKQAIADGDRLVDLVIDELLEEIDLFHDLDEELSGSQESVVDFLDDSDGDMSLAL